jgi:hypothetical protein
LEKSKRMFLCLIPIVLFTGAFLTVYAGDSTGISDASVIRMQLQSIAEEVVNRANFDTTEKVTLFTEGETWRILTENAFIEALQKRNYKTVLGSGTVTTRQVLQVYLLNADIKDRELGTKLHERIISTDLEVKKLTGIDREAAILGVYHRQTTDTINVLTDMRSVVFDKEGKKSAFEKLLTPLIVISGAVLIVYLFFTVRS